jgi:KDO2-lipid IV(A) lauroyltransferase
MTSLEPFTPSPVQRLGYLAIMSLGSLPLPLRRITAQLLGEIACRIPTRDQKIARAQLKLVLADNKQDEHLRGVYRSICQTLLETLNLFPILRRSEEMIDCEGLDELIAIRDSDRPAIFLSGHLGNWDLLAAYAVQQGFDLHAIGVPAQRMFFHHLLATLRARYGIRTIWRQKGSAKTILEVLGKGGNIAALIDQDTRVKSILCPFLGRPANTPVILVQMARKINAHLLTAFLVRTAPGRYRIETRTLDTGLSDKEVLTAYSSHLEDLIRQYPDQWVWFHKRWRTMSDGKTLGSKDYLAYLLQECPQ